MHRCTFWKETNKAWNEKKQNELCLLETHKVNIISLSWFDCKQYVLDDRIKTLA